MAERVEIPENEMVYHYDTLNSFEADGIPAIPASEGNRKIILHNVDIKIRAHAIKGILSQFGEVVDLHIPFNQESWKGYKEGFMTVFATFSKFTEAETAIQELNDEKNKGLKIKAAFSIPKMVNEPCPSPEPAPRQSPLPEEVTQQIFRPPLTVAFEDVVDDDVHEKVTEFERKKAYMSFANQKTLKSLKKIAKASMGFYDAEKETFEYNRELAESVVFSTCSQCPREAMLQCEVSSLFFCSLKCSAQSKEPKVKDEEPLVNEISYAQPIQANDVVTISAIVNEKCIYVKRKGVEDNLLLNNVSKFAKRAEKLERFPEIGNLVLARYMGEVYRAKVIEIHEDKDYALTVHLYDFGNTAEVVVQDLLAMEFECQKLKCFAHKVLLKDVQIQAINQRIIEYLDDLLTMSNELVVKEIDGDRVVLVDKLIGMNINKRIVELAEVETALFENDGALFDFEDIAFIPVGHNKRLFVTNSLPNPENPQVICCISEDNLKDFFQLYKTINAYATSRTIAITGIPQKDEIRLAFCNDQWHRANVLESFGDGFPVCLLIDIISSQKISYENIIPMPAMFKDPPPLATLCTIEGFDNNSSEEVKNHVASIIKEGSIFNVDEIDEQDGDYILKIKSLSKLLAEQT